MLTKTVVPADTEGGNAAMATDEVENIQHAESSVRDAILGKGDEKTERKMDRSVANSPAKYDIGTPDRNIEMEDEVGVQDGPARSSDLLSLRLSGAQPRNARLKMKTIPWGSTTSIDASLRTTPWTRSA